MKILETRRLFLRTMNMQEMHNLMRIFTDRVAMRFYPHIKNENDTREWIKWNMRSYARDGHGLWSAYFKDTQDFAGQCGLVKHEVDGNNEYEIGYLFLRKYWNQGLATEAVLACRDYGFNTIGCRRIVSLIDPENVASRRVAEKAGMHYEKDIIKWNRKINIYTIEKEIIKEASYAR